MQKILSSHLAGAFVGWRMMESMNDSTDLWSWRGKTIWQGLEDNGNSERRFWRGHVSWRRVQEKIFCVSLCMCVFRVIFAIGHVHLPERQKVRSRSPRGCPHHSFFSVLLLGTHRPSMSFKPVGLGLELLGVQRLNHYTTYWPFFFFLRFAIRHMCLQGWGE